MCFGPFHNFAKLVPVFHLLKREGFHRRARNDHTVEIARTHIFKGLIECEHMLLGGVAGNMGARVHQFDLYLQRRIAQQAGKLCFRVDLSGHQVQDQQLERPDILRDGTRFGHHENVFFRERFNRRQLVWDFYGHTRLLALCPAQRLIKIGNEVCCIFQAAGIPHKIRRNARCGQL